MAFLLERACLFLKARRDSDARSRLKRNLAYASRHREIIAINATGAREDVPVFERDDYMSLSNRQAAVERGRSDGSWRHHVGNHG